MCWQPLGLKDPASQELLQAVELERNFRFTPSRNATIFHYPTLGEFELQHLPVEVNNSELQDRIIQQLTAAAAMGRGHHLARRESSRSRSSRQGRQQFVVFSTQHSSSSAAPISASLTPSGGETVPAPATLINPSLQLTSIGDEQQQNMPSSVRSNRLSASSSRSLITPTGRGTPNDNSYASQSSLSNQDRAGPSEMQSFSDTWKSRFNAMSMKYKESISKSTRELKEKLFSRNSSMADISSEVRREVNAGIATVSCMMEHLEIRDNNNRAGHTPLANSPVDSSVTVRSNHDDMDTRNEAP